MNPSQDFSRLYIDVSESITAAMGEIAELKVEHKDGKRELSNMMERLGVIQARFDGELGLLEQHAEWDKFTIAFFGETNAGKSTIIDSLRILLNEDLRQQLLQTNNYDLAKYEQALVVHVSQIREGMNKAYAAYAAEIVAIKQSTSALTRLLQLESSARMKRKLWMAAIGGISLGCVVVCAIALIVVG